MLRCAAARLALPLAAVLALAACGGNDDPAPDTGAAAPAVAADLGREPDVPASDAPPPAELVVEDVVVGAGAEATSGAVAEVKYVGAFYDTGEEFDSSWRRGADETLPVPLGQGAVIEGFERGIEGMREGGRRIVTIPSDLGYGDQGQGPIPGGSTLVFVIDLVSVG